MRLTLPDAKRIFEMFDPNETGFVDGGNIIRLAGLGSTPDDDINSNASNIGHNSHYDDSDSSNNSGKNNSDSNYTEMDVKDAIVNLCGKNSHILEYCFATSDSKKTVRLQNYENFVKSLKDGGMCKNMSLVKDLFLSVGGASGMANISQVRPSAILNRNGCSAIHFD